MRSILLNKKICDMRVFDRDVLIPKKPFELVINLGYLEPGFYRITENEEMSKLMKEPLGLIDDNGPNRIPCQFRPVFDEFDEIIESSNKYPSFSRYGFVNRKSNFSYHLRLWSREAYLKEHPVDSFDKDFSFYGTTLKDYDKFIEDLAPSGIYRFTFDFEKVADLPLN